MPLPSSPWLPVGTTLAVLVLWETASRTGLLPADTLPPASAVLTELFRLLAASVFWGSVWHTLSSTLLGLLVVTVLGTILGLAIGLSRIVRESTYLVVEFLKPIPTVAMVPLGLLLLGPSQSMKLALITFGAVWPFLTQIVYGIDQVDGVALEMGRSYRLQRRQVTWYIVIPSLLPFAATGLRVSAAIALVVSVVTELIGGVAGIGRDIVVAQSAGDLNRMYALILAAGVLGLALNALFAALEKPLLVWHPKYRKEVR